MVDTRSRDQQLASDWPLQVRARVTREFEQRGAEEQSKIVREFELRGAVQMARCAVIGHSSRRAHL